MVLGLAWRCASSRSVKNASSVGASELMAAAPPLSARGVGQRGLHIDAGAVPVEQSGDGKAVAEIVQPRPAARRAWLQADGLEEASEGAADAGGMKPVAGR